MYDVIITRFDGTKYVMQMPFDDFEAFAQRHVGQDCADASLFNIMYTGRKTTRKSYD